jgi:YD repeat-containing protein
MSREGYQNATAKGGAWPPFLSMFTGGTGMRPVCSITGFVLGFTLLVTPALAADTTYVYDVHGQVVGVTRATGATGYVYDLAGNRTQVTGAAGSAMMARELAAETALRSASAGPSLLPPPSLATRSLPPPSLEAPPPGIGPLPATPGVGPRGEPLPAPSQVERPR